MKETEVIQKTLNNPATVQSLANDLSALGITSAMTVLVHSSLSSLGWVCGGAVAAILALETVLGDKGTLVMPTHSSDLSDPANWQNPPVPESWWELMRETMPAYDPDLTPTRGMGVIPECFRKQKGVLRSSHPQVSFAARGIYAPKIIEGHSFNFGLGEGSPLARIYEVDGWVLLLGVGHDSNTSLHLAEYRAEYPGKKLIENGAPLLFEGQRQWVKMQDIEFDDSDFARIGEYFARETELVRRGFVARATAMLMPQRPLVDYAVEWMQKNRQQQVVCD